MPVLVLFGAGASYGSEPNGKQTTPLGADLFQALVDLGGLAAAMSEKTKQAFFKDFEEGMALFNVEHENLREAFHREMSLFLGRFTPSEDNRYISLLRNLKGKNVVYSSLNYDMLLELSAQKLGLGTEYSWIRSYGNIRLIKPHGSINFWPDLGGNFFDNIISAGCQTVISAPVRPVSWEQCINLNLRQTSFSPAISMYAKGKRVMVCPEFVNTQQNYFEHACKTASKIFIIGVRVVEEDTHIWDAIARSRADVTYFGGENDEKDFTGWANKNRHQGASFILGYFDTAVEHISKYA